MSGFEFDTAPEHCATIQLELPGVERQPLLPFKSFELVTPNATYCVVEVSERDLCSP